MEKLSKQDLIQLQQIGISEIDLQKQMQDFEKGFPYASLADSAQRGKGVFSFLESDQERYSTIYENFSFPKGREPMKFVPASGAATRMFKSLFAFYENPNTPATATPNLEVESFFSHLPKFAFYQALSECLAKEGYSIEKCLEKKDYLPILDSLLEHGLQYGNLPKALLLFHSYGSYFRTALEEHLVEAALYANKNSKCRLHFTVSPEFLPLFKLLEQKVLPIYEKRFSIKYEITYSTQKSSTNTMAVTTDNQIFREEGKRIVFRPGGHGALIENLNEIEADLIFIKNIDNVSTETHCKKGLIYKRMLAGFLLEVRQQSFLFLEALQKEKLTPELITTIAKFAKEKLCMVLPLDLGMPIPSNAISIEEQGQILFELLNRPIRVCGMVKNEGEPGGGPFWVWNKAKAKEDSQGRKSSQLSLQIVESAQIDMADPLQKEIFSKSTYFNPVDLVCSVYNYQGEKFDLKQYIDPSTAFISQKSVKGREIKAMELPGLWNGAMANWTTLFVEVPKTVFTPVKSVNDLLRKEHNNTRDL
ncbi:MAG: DUF4301 family protein [Bacteroidales bacterium]